MYQNNPLDEKIDRKHSDSVKYGAGNRDPEREKLLPLGKRPYGCKYVRSVALKQYAECKGY